MYSQNNEESIIRDYFRHQRYGFFLDLGANDGETLSNTRALALSGWDGVLVEPSSSAYAKLAQLYKRDDGVIFVNAAITTQNGPVDFYDSGTHLKKGDTSLLSTTRESELKRWEKSGETFTKTTVRGITFETLMAEAGRANFDFISIDCEGMDYEILQQIDLTAVGCRLLCVEYNNGDPAPFLAYGAKHGLHLIHRNYENVIMGR